MTAVIFPKSNKVNVTYGSFKVRATSQDVIDSSPKEIRNLVVNPGVRNALPRVKLSCLLHSCIKFPANKCQGTSVSVQVGHCGQK